MGHFRSTRVGLDISDTSRMLQRQIILTSNFLAIPRLYHSVCTLLLDGTLLVAGSSPNEMPVLAASSTNPYVTEYRVENYVPPYLQGANANRRPTNINIPGKTVTANGSKFGISFSSVPGAQAVKIALYHGKY